MAMMRWIIENAKYNSDYLTLPNLDEAKRYGFSCYSNVTHLIIDEPNHPHYGRFLRQSDLDGGKREGGGSFMVVDREGNVKPFDTIERTELEPDMTVADGSGNIRVVTAFKLTRSFKNMSI